jgi:ATP-dependent RNA helicase DDX35
MAAGKREF